MKSRRRCSNSRNKNLDIKILPNNIALEKSCPSAKLKFCQRCLKTKACSLNSDSLALFGFLGSEFKSFWLYAMCKEFPTPSFRFGKRFGWQLCD